jgi:hypothetical protein
VNQAAASQADDGGVAPAWMKRDAPPPVPAVRYRFGVPRVDGPAASTLIERERRFHALNARARGIDLRIDVLSVGRAPEGATLFQPIDLTSGKPVLGPELAPIVLTSLDEVQVFLDAQLGFD